LEGTAISPLDHASSIPGTELDRTFPGEICVVGSGVNMPPASEQPSAAPGRIADYWGCVALVCNPDRKVPEDLLKAWTDRIGLEADYGKVTQTKEEDRLIDETGRLLSSNWLRRARSTLWITALDTVVFSGCCV
jgi:hypothetical protein